MFHTACLSASDFQVKNTQKHFLFPGSSCAETLPWQKTTDSCSFLLKKYLIVVNLSHITLSLTLFYPFYLDCFWRRNLLARTKLFFLMKTLFQLFSKSPNARKFCFSFCFLSFYRFFFLFLIFGLLRNFNQVTLSNEHMNHLFRG